MIDKPKEYNLIVRIGRSYRKRFRVKDSVTGLGADLTGWRVKSDIRETQLASSQLIASFVVDITDLANGYFTLSIPETAIDAISEGLGYYDVVLTDPSGFDDTYFFGYVQFITGATPRPAP